MAYDRRSFQGGGGGGGGGSSSPWEGGRGELGLPIRPDFFPGGRCSLGRFFRLVGGVGLGVARGMIMVFTIGRWPYLGELVGQGLLSPTVGSLHCESHIYSQVRLGLQKAVSFMYFSCLVFQLRPSIRRASSSHWFKIKIQESILEGRRPNLLLGRGGLVNAGVICRCLKSTGHAGVHYHIFIFMIFVA